MVLILQRLMVKSPDRSAFIGVVAAVTGPLTFKSSIVVLIMFTTLVAPQLVVLSVTVALTKLKLLCYSVAIINREMGG